jgi:hypothetical protein
MVEGEWDITKGMVKKIFQALIKKWREEKRKKSANETEKRKQS